MIFGRNKSKITKQTNKQKKKKNGENAPYLEINEVVLTHFNVVNNNYQQNTRVFYTFVPNKSFGALLDIWPKNFIFLIHFDSKFLYIEVWFNDQNSQPLEIKVKINITLVIN